MAYENAIFIRCDCRSSHAVAVIVAVADECRAIWLMDSNPYETESNECAHAQARVCVTCNLANFMATSTYPTPRPLQKSPSQPANRHKCTNHKSGNVNIYYFWHFFPPVRASTFSCTNRDQINSDHLCNFRGTSHSLVSTGRPSTSHRNKSRAPTHTTTIEATLIV